MLKDWIAEDGKLTVYAWPGGYPVLYLMSDGESLCPACAQMAQDEGLGGADDPQWDIRDGYIHWEGAPETCAHCNVAMESAYGDPDEEATG